MSEIAFRSILLTGASSGIGRALALRWARPGVRLGLTGRDPTRLAEVAAQATALGADVATAAVDAADRAAMATTLLGWDDAAPCDLLVANAGISAGTGGGAGEEAAQLRRIVAVNIDGVINSVTPLIPRMVARGRGQIGLMASLASFRGFPGAPGYCASKAFVRVWGEGLRGQLAPAGVGVSVICPGFVASRITDANDFPMPMLMSAERAAVIIDRGLRANRGRIAFPGPMAFAAWALAALPDALVGRIARAAPKKPAGL